MKHPDGGGLSVNVPVKSLSVLGGAVEIDLTRTEIAYFPPEILDVVGDIDDPNGDRNHRAKSVTISKSKNLLYEFEVEGGLFEENQRTFLDVDTSQNSDVGLYHGVDESVVILGNNGPDNTPYFVPLDKITQEFGPGTDVGRLLDYIGVTNPDNPGIGEPIVTLNVLTDLVEISNNGYDIDAWAGLHDNFGSFDITVAPQTGVDGLVTDHAFLNYLDNDTSAAVDAISNGYFFTYGGEDDIFGDLPTNATNLETSDGAIFGSFASLDSSGASSGLINFDFLADVGDMIIDVADDASDIFMGTLDAGAGYFLEVANDIVSFGTDLVSVATNAVADIASATINPGALIGSAFNYAGDLLDFSFYCGSVQDFSK